MFSVIYTFKVKPELEKKFIENWIGFTQLIYEHEGSLGSKLHRDQNGNFVAYAQWPSEEVWKNAGSNLPKESADAFRNGMKESYLEMKTEYKLEMIVDLTRTVKHVG
jgi:heme-degrading monooxygenase HmoA